MIRIFIELMERGLIPDWLIRLGVRHLCRGRLASLQRLASGPPGEAQKAYADRLARAPLALATDEANRQHYEVPADFYLSVLGPARKYSCTYFESPQHSLAEAERRALDITLERAELADGMRILELGCGWGSLTLHMARAFPGSRITAVSNSASQRRHIEGRAREEGLTNIEVRTLDLGSEESIRSLPTGFFDRAVSVEMFEHFRNYRKLLFHVSRFLKPEGKLFVHIFTHRSYSYPFDTEGDDNWLGRYFFTGGQMPARGLLREFQEDLRIERQWEWNGIHYQRTADAWLRNLDSSRPEIMEIFTKTYGRAEARRWLERWRVFFIACSELFGYRQGSEWAVTHYLFSRGTSGGTSA